MVVQASVLFEENITWHALSYVPSASFAWWIFLLSLFLFFVILRLHLASSRNLMTLIYVMMAVALIEGLYALLSPGFLINPNLNGFYF